MERKMGNQKSNWWVEQSNSNDLSVINPAGKEEKSNSDNPAFYFIALIFVLLLTFTFFKKEIFELLF
jgi:hypothetical protein